MPDAPKSLYPTRDRSNDVDECAQCFYQPETKEKPVEKEGTAPAAQPVPEVDDCAQCFYQPTKPAEK